MEPQHVAGGGDARPFKPGSIEGVVWKPLTRFHDKRGWLCELFRDYELPADFRPAMAYISSTEPGVARGPHEHVDQADCFCFIGPSNFLMAVWDNRPSSPTFRNHEYKVVGADQPMLIIVPAGVVHGYKNVGGVHGLVFNCPNQLYKGMGRKEPIDEIRHEADPNSPFHFPK